MLMVSTSVGLLTSFTYCSKLDFVRPLSKRTLAFLAKKCMNYQYKTYLRILEALVFGVLVVFYRFKWNIVQAIFNKSLVAHSPYNMKLPLRAVKVGRCCNNILFLVTVYPKIKESSHLDKFYACTCI